MKETNVKRRAKVINCKYFKSCGNVYGGCKHPKATSACLFDYIDKCSMSEKRYKTNKCK